eukprot:12820916-Alexandrium_andersonii.AAC.1
MVWLSAQGWGLSFWFDIVCGSVCVRNVCGVLCAVRSMQCSVLCLGAFRAHQTDTVTQEVIKSRH